MCIDEVKKPQETSNLIKKQIENKLNWRAGTSLRFFIETEPICNVFLISLATAVKQYLNLRRPLG